MSNKANLFSKISSALNICWGTCNHHNKFYCWLSTWKFERMDWEKWELIIFVRIRSKLGAVGSSSGIRRFFRRTIAGLRGFPCLAIFLLIVSLMNWFFVRYSICAVIKALSEALKDNLHSSWVNDQDYLMTYCITSSHYFIRCCPLPLSLSKFTFSLQSLAAPSQKSENESKTIQCPGGQVVAMRCCPKNPRTVLIVSQRTWQVSRGGRREERSKEGRDRREEGNRVRNGRWRRKEGGVRRGEGRKGRREKKGELRGMRGKEGRTEVLSSSAPCSSHQLSPKAWKQKLFVRSPSAVSLVLSSDWAWNLLPSFFLPLPPLLPRKSVIYENRSLLVPLPT